MTVTKQLILRTYIREVLLSRIYINERYGFGLYLNLDVQCYHVECYHHLGTGGVGSLHYASQVHVTTYCDVWGISYVKRILKKLGKWPRILLGFRR
jgi:hypothetical protein